MDNKKIGNRIKSRRKELNLTLKQIADIVGVASSTIQRYENGTISQLKLPVLESIAKALDINPTWLVRDDAPMILNHLNKSENIKKQNSLELILLDSFNKLNKEGKNEAIKRVEELTYISKYIEENTNVIELPKREKQVWEEPGKEHLMPIASHDRNGEFTEEEYQHDDDLMDDEDFWK
ncbi:helix-turn-helix domain-containing protein [Clostridium sp. Sa3CUN1]|uniref:Helix-turn-helix domain-containing protein n=1 Tax=Clostridium gallinarum TaxID=2762246 RepID=A0ABR8Q1F0_9CLOT|nr:helix-turn-helix domain-containing protein [Clostridium gallinarum]MBD7914245.1 helix-turn-helix domain-containing protein [Clostridium gallinarum]